MKLLNVLNVPKVKNDDIRQAPIDFTLVFLLVF